MNSLKHELGCGLIRIGRVWGFESKKVPTEKEALGFLEFAFSLGIRFFDTAPAYGLSEARLGKFLKSLTSPERSKITVATKFGEHWDEVTSDTYVDHSYKALSSSVEKSMSLLGQVTILQLHKASVDLLNQDSVSRALEYALTLGVTSVGTSVSDIETGLASCDDERFSYIQLPYNQQRSDLLPVINQAKSKNKRILFNRPLAMGAIAQSPDKEQAIFNAYSFIHQTNAPGVILTGTASVEHLKENMNIFIKL